VLVQFDNASMLQMPCNTLESGPFTTAFVLLAFFIIQRKRCAFEGGSLGRQQEATRCCLQLVLLWYDFGRQSKSQCSFAKSLRGCKYRFQTFHCFYETTGQVERSGECSQMKKDGALSMAETEVHREVEGTKRDISAWI
jgi:hypothetical protein